MLYYITYADFAKALTCTFFILPLDYRRFIEKTSVTTDEEIADKNTFCLNTERITEEELYDGYYAVVTNLEAD